VRKVATWIAIVAIVLAVLWVLMHLFLSPVNPKQKAPSKHIDAPCWTCHLVLEQAKIKTTE
jgi:cytochrome c553